MRAERFEEAIRAVLPQGWAFAGGERKLVLRRERSVMFYSNSHIPEIRSEEAWQAFLQTYGFEGSFMVVLWFDRPFPATVLEDLAERNRQTAATRDQMIATLGKRVRFHKDHFHPEGAEQCLLVDQFRLSCSAMPDHRLPEVNTPEFSAYLASSFDRGGAPGEVGLHPEEAQRECRAVVEAVTQVLRSLPAS